MSVSQPSKVLSFNERLGMVFIVEVAFLSAIAVSSVLFYYLYATLAAIRDPRRARPSTHIHHYFVSLLVADLIQALGSILNIQWIMDAGVVENEVCTAQGALKQVGDVGVAMSTLVIAIHTARVLVFKVHFSAIVPRIVLGLIWVFVALMLAVGFGLHHAKDIQFYGNTGYWCWITENYSTQRITLEYLWLWVSALVNIVCYLGIFLVIKGIIVVDGKNTRVHNGNSFSITSSQVPHSARTNSIARQMLFYPAVYIICILPMTVCRFIAFSGRQTPYGATVFASILFSGSGLFNVILFRFTRPSLMPRRSPETGFHNKSQPPVEVSIKFEAFQVTSVPNTPIEYAPSDHSYPPGSSPPTRGQWDNDKSSTGTSSTPLV